MNEREIGLPTRVLYDTAMPMDLLDQLKAVFQLTKADLIPGARYHNFNDFFGFPNPSQKKELHDQALPPQKHAGIEAHLSLMEAIRVQDRMLHFPYQRYDYVPQLIREAAEDEDLHSIKITRNLK